jgi:hypothetical protein
VHDAGINIKHIGFGGYASELPTCAEEEGDEREERVHAAEDEASDEDAGSLQAPPRPGKP